MLATSSLLTHVESGRTEKDRRARNKRKARKERENILNDEDNFLFKGKFKAKFLLFSHETKQIAIRRTGAEVERGEAVTTAAPDAAPNTPRRFAGGHPTAFVN
ncbi:hypothetical protein EVAR_9905_1 [Eumeta japonica]|uniref:Uncharacterized protein n=1 Tax=Eumeta variegata TaxID=151549 RepID=A0A4C1TQD1_EUMVA|nr:hypothetical protein EVAR_9905_1 [Eumeta japonica]